MICVLALIVFSILAVFSAKYRPLAKEAFDCVFRRITLRKCQSGLDKRIKNQLTGKILKKNKKIGLFIYKYFEVFSWLFLILLILSATQAGISTYNYVKYGNCNGPSGEGFCIFDPTAGSISQEGFCPANAKEGTEPVLPENINSELEDKAWVGNKEAGTRIIEFGCFSCPNTAKQAKAIKEIIKEYGKEILLIYIDFPIPSHEYAEEAAISSYCVRKQSLEKYWEYHFKIFEKQKELNPEKLREWAEETGINMNEYDDCIKSPEAKQFVEKEKELGIKTGIYGTPTIFIGNNTIIGVHNKKFLETKIKEEINKNQ